MTEREKAIAALRRGRVVVLAGEGLLRTAGLAPPASRGGLWDDYGVAQCATPEALERHPDVAWAAFSAWQQQTRAALARPLGPSKAYTALATLAQSGRIRGALCTTTDGLLRGMQVIDTAELHGAIDLVRCRACQHRGPAPGPYRNRAPFCPACNAALRPDMVLFGEALPRAPRQRAASWVYGGGCLLVLGADLTRPPIHRIPEEMMQEGGLTISLGDVARGAVTRVRGVHLSDDIEATLPGLIAEVMKGGG